MCVKSASQAFTRTATILCQACYKCPRNAISPLNGSISCSICAHGKFSNDRIECVVCPSGYYKEDYMTHSNCTKCAVGRYQPDQEQSDCIDCKEGEYQNEEAKQFCISCNPGKYASSVRSSDCYACQDGRYQPGVGKSGCMNITVGYEGIGGNTSLENPGHMAEIPCSAGKYGNESKCLPCGAGTYSGATASVCKDCPSGFSQAISGQASCLPCIPGEYQNKTKSISCEGCPIGYVSETKATSWREVFAGSMTVNAGSASCVDCQAGEFLLDRVCEKCARDTYTASSKQTTCEFCPNGYHALEGMTFCEICPSGWQISGELGSRICLQCSHGKISTAGGNCTDCKAGSYANQDKTDCTLCPQATWSNSVGANDLSTCRNCSAGFYSAAKV